MTLSVAEYGRATEPWVSDFLAACVRLIGAKRVLEIGVLRGHTTRKLLAVLPGDGEYVAVDPEPQPEFDAIRDPRLKLFRGESKDVLPEFKEPFDFIFVDGDHTFSGAQQDIDESLRLIRPGGVIAVHDTLSSHEPCVGLATRLHLPEAVHFKTAPFEWGYVTGLALYSKPPFDVKIQFQQL